MTANIMRPRGGHFYHSRPIKTFSLSRGFYDCLRTLFSSLHSTVCRMDLIPLWLALVVALRYGTHSARSDTVGRAAGQQQQKQQHQHQQHSPHCRISEFGCADGTCIATSKYCDGYADCMDQSDEAAGCSGKFGE